MPRIEEDHELTEAARAMRKLMVEATERERAAVCRYLRQLAASMQGTSTAREERIVLETAAEGIESAHHILGRGHRS